MLPQTFHFVPLTHAHVHQIFDWRYPEPYALYNPSAGGSLPELEQALLNPDFFYHAVLDEQGELLAYRCFGADATVPGGDYSEERLDMGGGLRPDLTGRGLGPHIMRAAVAFANRRFGATRFRTTVAAFNQRAIKACQKAGYRRVDSFHHPVTDREFVILVREVEEGTGNE